MDKNSYLKKITSLLLAVAVSVTFAPLFEGSVYADETQDVEVPEIEATLDDADGLSEDVGMEDEDSAASEPSADVIPEDPADPEEIESEADDIDGADDDPDTIETKTVLSTKSAKVRAISGKDYNLNLKQNGKIVTINGTIKYPYLPQKLYLDTPNSNIGYKWSINGRTRIDTYRSGESVKMEATINMAKYPTGYHSLFIEVTDTTQSTHSKLKWMYLKSNNIAARPNYSGSFTVYSKSVAYRPFNDYGGNYDPFSPIQQKLYVEYKKKKGGKWKRSASMQYKIGSSGAGQSFSVGGFKASTKYKTRIRYGDVVTYKSELGGDGKSYFFGGPVLNTSSFKTGKAKSPAVKKVTAKAVNVQKQKTVDSKFYIYDVKVTVKLKKKPGTKGICVNGRFLQGNKTKYTTTFKIRATSPKKPKGHAKFKVSVQSARSAKYGGYSPAWSKKKKLV